MRSLTMVAVSVGLLLAGAAIAAFIWWQVTAMELSGHGIVALVLGILLTLGLGVGLMFLVFYSNRRGHDEPVRYKL